MRLNDFLTFLILTFAVYRLSGLIVYDRGPFGMFLKTRALFGILASRKDQKGFFFEMAEGTHCIYCVGVWVAFVGAFVMKPETVIDFFVFWLGLAGFQSFLYSLTTE